MNPILSSTNISRLSSTLLSGYSAMNNMRLAQALDGKSSAISAVSPVRSSLSTDTSEYLKEYQTGMADMLAKATSYLGTKTGEAGAGGEEEFGAKADAMEALVSSFNSTLEFLSEHESQGMGVLTQMKRMVTPPTSEKSMADIGLTAGADGSLSFDRSKFLAAMEEDSTRAGGIANTVAQGIQSDARMGMQQSSHSLVSSVLSSGTQKASYAYDTDTLNFLNAYNRSGVYNSINYLAVGALMNISI